MPRGLPVLLLFALGLASSPAGATDPAEAATRPPSLVLLTLDTTRADHIGAYGADTRTPHLDALAARGTRWARALTPAPLTLPAHCSLMTGLDPPEHGVRDNGIGSLPAEVPTLAETLAAAGYTTGAVVGSLVLDRRFGLARGFDHYDDRMTAELVGEYGYPERGAAQVTDAALAWLAGFAPEQPVFLWAHYYDPHSPYAGPPEAAPAARYRGEIELVDREIGRLLEAIPDGALIAVVGDHGEMLHEHGERAHGILLYRAALEVPLIVAGPGVPAGRVVTRTVGIRGLAATLAKRLGLTAGPFGAALPGLADGDGDEDDAPIYSETLLPATAYGWSGLRAITRQHHRLVVGPRPALYDFVTDPGETRNRIAADRATAARLKNDLESLRASWVLREAPPPEGGAELGEALRSLGYLSGASGSREGDIDPHDGIGMLEEFDAAKELLRSGNAVQARDRLADLVRRSPGNVPFLGRLGEAQLAAGDGERAVATLQRAARLNPRLDFLHAQLADGYRTLGRLDEARAEYELALELNPRMPGAHFALALMAREAGDREAERRVLERAHEAGTDSASLLSRLGQLELEAGRPARAAELLERATLLLPDLPSAWWLRGLATEAQGDQPTAIACYTRAIELFPNDPSARLHLGRLLHQRGEATRSERHLRAVIQLAPGTEGAREAQRLLATSPPDDSAKP